MALRRSLYITLAYHKQLDAVAMRPLQAHMSTRLIVYRNTNDERAPIFVTTAFGGENKFQIVVTYL